MYSFVKVKQYVLSGDVVELQDWIRLCVAAKVKEDLFEKALILEVACECTMQ